MRVLVTGSREWTDREMIRKAFVILERHAAEVSVVHGDQGDTDDDGVAVRGLDKMAAQLARSEFRWGTEPYPAQWEKKGKQAGFLRNTEMVRSEPKADLCLAFPLPGSVGTWDCIDKASDVGIPVVIVGLGTWQFELTKVLQDRVA